MKKIKITLCCLLCPLWLLAQDKFTVQGKFEQPPKGAVQLSYQLELKTKPIKATATIRNGSFTFSGIIKKPVAATLRLGKDSLDFYLEAATIRISTANLLKNAKISGSALNNDYAEFKKIYSTYNAALMKLKATDSKVMLKEFQIISNNHIARLKAFAKAHPKSAKIFKLI